MKQSVMVSVVIPTLNRYETLCATIDYFLTRESYRPFELIVIDQSDREDEKPQVPESVRSRIRYERVGYKSLPRARNDALSRAKGEIIVFVDDDTEPFEGFLSGHVAPYSEERIWAVTGPTLAPGEMPVSRSQIDAERYKRLLAGSDVCVQADFDYAPCSWGPGCNLSVRKKAAELVGGFDERFVGNALGEDAEFCHRIKKRGGIIYYSGGAGLVHLKEAAGGCRTDIGAQFVEKWAYNTNYFWRAVDGSLSNRIRANWNAYRQFVLNPQNLTDLNLHRAFLKGAFLGLSRPRSEGERF